MVEIETATMSDRGQIIIPKGIREFMRAEENTTFTIMPLDKDTIVMKRLNKLKLLEEFRNIRKHVRKRLSPEEIQDEISSYRKSKHH